MSKIAEALKKAEELRKVNGMVSAQQNNTGLHSMLNTPDVSIERSAVNIAESIANDREQAPVFSFQNSMLIALALICLISLLLSTRTFSEIKRTNQSAVVMTHMIASHEAKIGALEKTISDMQLHNAAEAESLKTKLNTVSTVSKKIETKVNDLTSAQGELRSSINGFKWSLSHLTDRLNSIADQGNTSLPIKE